MSDEARPDEALTLQEADLARVLDVRELSS